MFVPYSFGIYHSYLEKCSINHRRHCDQWRIRSTNSTHLPTAFLFQRRLWPSKGRKVSDLINKSSSCERSGAPKAVGAAAEGEKWRGVNSGGGDAGEGGSSLLLLCYNAYQCWQRRTGPGDKVFHSHVQHPAAEPTNVALLSMRGLIR